MKETRLSNLSINQLRSILHQGFDETDVCCILYNAFGERLCSFPDTTEINPRVHNAATAALNECSSQTDYATEVIRHGEGVEGVLVVWVEPPRQMSAFTAQLLRMICLRIEDALETQEEIDALSTEILNDYRELGLIYTLSQELAGLTDMNRVYHVVLEHVVEIVKANTGYIFKLDKTTGELHIVQGYPDLMEVNPFPPVQFGEGVIGSVAQTGEPILIEDTEHPLWQTQSREFLTPPLMACALQIGKTALGVIVVSRDSEEAVFEAGDLKILQSASLQSAAAMMNVNFLTELKQSNQELQQEIAERKRMEAQLRHSALHDDLTGLPNRTFFMECLQQSIETAKSSTDVLFAILFLDLDRFKVINDSLGHTVGDGLLILLAKRLKTCLRPEDTVARLGGDEFAILLADIKDSRDAIHVAERVHKQLGMPFHINGHEVFTSASVGIVLSGYSYEKPEEILRDADMAMYRAKAAGNPYELFDTDMHASAVKRLQMENDLRWAVERDEFRLHYQPILSLDSGKILGFEALIRWQHPDGNLISPGEFIPVAEETGLIVPLGEWVIREACRQISVWDEKFPTRPDLVVNINLSSKQLMQPALVEQIGQILAQSQIDPRRLNLEITESAIMENPDFAAIVLLRLKAMHLQVQLDDFGTGYSSLSYLHRFPIDTLKIDRSFVNRMELDRHEKIIETIVSLAHHLDMTVTAEGIETQDQLKQLQGMACERGQGYYFSKPLEVEAAEALINESLEE